MTRKRMMAGNLQQWRRFFQISIKEEAFWQEECTIL